MKIWDNIDLTKITLDLPDDLVRQLATVGESLGDEVFIAIVLSDLARTPKPAN